MQTFTRLKRVAVGAAAIGLGYGLFLLANNSVGCIDNETGREGFALELDGGAMPPDGDVPGDGGLTGSLTPPPDFGGSPVPPLPPPTNCPSGTVAIWSTASDGTETHACEPEPTLAELSCNGSPMYSCGPALDSSDPDDCGSGLPSCACDCSCEGSGCPANFECRVQLSVERIVKTCVDQSAGFTCGEGFYKVTDPDGSNPRCHNLGPQWIQTAASNPDGSVAITNIGCNTADDCPTGVCIQQPATGFKQCAPCLQSSDCGPNEVCHLEHTDDGVCVGRPCTTESDCRSGLACLEPDPNEPQQQDAGLATATCQLIPVGHLAYTPDQETEGVTFIGSPPGGPEEETVEEPTADMQPEPGQ